MHHRLGARRVDGRRRPIPRLESRGDLGARFASVGCVALVRCRPTSGERTRIGALGLDGGAQGGAVGVRAGCRRVFARSAGGRPVCCARSVDPTRDTYRSPSPSAASTRALPALLAALDLASRGHGSRRRRTRAAAAVFGCSVAGPDATLRPRGAGAQPGDGLHMTQRPPHPIGPSRGDTARRRPQIRRHVRRGGVVSPPHAAGDPTRFGAES